MPTKTTRRTKTSASGYDEKTVYAVTLNRPLRKSPAHPIVYRPRDQHRFTGKALITWVPDDAIDTAEPV